VVQLRRADPQRQVRVSHVRPEDVMTLFDRAVRRRQRWDDDQFAESLRWAWRNACIGSGLCNVVNTVTGPTESVPRVGAITPGPPTFFIAELLPGQIVSDVRAVAHRLAGPLGAVALRIESRGLRHIRVELLANDPLLGTVARARAVKSARTPVMIGRDEQARPVTIALESSAHLIVQGSSGSGKSTGVYGLLAQLAHAPDVMVVGSDITRLTLAPWATRLELKGWHALGTRDPAAHVRVLERAVGEMDRRIEAMPPGHDAVPIGPDTPLMVFVAEEVPGLMRVLSTANRDLEKRARALLARLVGESRKAGIRVLLIAQRADANIIGGYERGQASHTISFRVDNHAALAMLHADADKAIAAEHATARDGVALLSAPGDPLRRFRAPLTTYADYCREVATDDQSAA
jgi:S-DNA-T family DNA segregation ATPase FtsK/SpoIIIE